MTEQTLQGSCLCKQVTYQIQTPLKVFQYCHCSRCQKVSGSAFAANLFVPKAQLIWTQGEDLLGRYEIPDAKYYATCFCKNCGSNLPWLTKTGETYILPAGSLDSELEMKPKQNIFCQDTPDWHINDADLPKFVHGPFVPKLAD